MADTPHDKAFDAGQVDCRPDGDRVRDDARPWASSRRSARGHGAGA